MENLVKQNEEIDSKVNKCFVLSIEISKLAYLSIIKNNGEYWYYKQEIFRKIISCQYIMCKDIVKNVELTNTSTN